MQKSHLVPCVSCARHVRASERACPFCGAGVPSALRDSPRPRAPTARLSRAALMALGTGAAALATACGGQVEGREDGGVTIMPAYGLAVQPVDAGDYDAMTAALYGGISPPVDASVSPPDASTTPPPDAGSSPPPFDGGAAPPYGLPP